MNEDKPNDFFARAARQNAIVEAEQRWIGWQLKGDPGAVEFAAKELRNDAMSFQVPHNRIQQTILAAFDAGRTASAKTITAELADYPPFHEVGGMDYLCAMAGAAPATTSTENVQKQMRETLLSWRHLQDPIPKPGSVELVRADAVKLEAIDWIWRGWLAAGKFHLIAGAPGTGKTTLSLAMAATITIGGVFPCGARAERGSVLMWTGEDDLGDSIVPRFKACGGDVLRLRCVSGVRAEDGSSRPFDPAYDIEQLTVAARNISDLKLLIVDPLVSVITGDSHKNGETRRDLQPLVDFAANAGVAVLGVTHYSKGTAGRDPAERVTGSVAFVAVSRLVMVTAKPKEPGDFRRLVRAKSNIGPDGGGFEYELKRVIVEHIADIEGQCVTWGTILEGTAQELLAEVEAPDSGAQASKLQAAEDWLKRVLGNGPLPARDMRAMAERDGHKWATVKRAKERLEVESFQEGEAWYWRLAQVPTQ